MPTYAECKVLKQCMKCNNEPCQSALAECKGIKGYALSLEFELEENINQEHCTMMLNYLCANENKE